MSKQHLVLIQEYLKGRFNVELQTPNKLTPVHQLIVELGKDYKNRELFLHITEQESSISPNRKKVKTLDVITLNFFLMLPFQVKDEYMLDLCRFLFRVNTNCELGSLNLRDKEHLVVYQYSHLTVGQELNIESIDIVVTMIEFLLDTFEESIEQIASGAKSLKKLEEESYEMLKGSELNK